MSIQSILKKRNLHTAEAPMNFIHRSIGIDEVKGMMSEAKQEVIDENIQ